MFSPKETKEDERKSNVYFGSISYAFFSYPSHHNAKATLPEFGFCFVLLVLTQ
jgi:hypothetical protein